MLGSAYRVGDPVVYRVWKHTTRPGPRAEDVQPEPRGDFYRYSVKKFWRVAEVLADGRLRLITRRGKQRIVAPSDRRLRKARLWERVLFRDRFPQLPAHGGGPPDA